ncbi:hypothetical protein Leryth_021531 [Lithospermum erythrorhizon]|nr:hypothetical protein Leryth_021531 [Lithospermum erythrorhizon]
MALSVPPLLKERKYPFIFSFFLLLIFATFLVISDFSESNIPSNNTNSISQEEEQLESSSNGIVSYHPPLPPPPPPPPQPPTETTTDTNAISNNVETTNTKNLDTTNHDNVDVGNVGTKIDNSSNGNAGNLDIPDWEMCGGVAAVDYIPCLDNWKVIKALKSRRHMEHRERHCPEKALRCLVPLPQGYKAPVPWPKSRDMIWYDNVPHPKLVEYKKDQRWVVKSGDYFIFPGGGTQFKEGVKHYIDSVHKTLPSIDWGKRTRVILDVGCGVASFGGNLLDKGVITMSLAPKDEHEAQIQFALERGIPATLSVIGTQKLTFPDNAYDLIHCARCRVHWDADGGKPVMELNRILRPGGYFVWSATPVYRDDERDQKVWKAMVEITESMCWKVVKKEFFNESGIGLVIYQKPESSSCYENRQEKDPPFCENTRSNSSWYAPLERCLPPLPSYKWPASWPDRLKSQPPSMSSSPEAGMLFNEDTKHWSALVSDVYLGSLAINWTNMRNIMDMNAGYGGFAAALNDLPLWVMNIVPIDGPDTLSIIFDRGLIGVYHDWCESLNTYPRSYDLLHSSFLFGNLTKRCDIIDIAVEMDRVLRPGGILVLQDTFQMINMLSEVLQSLKWTMTLHQGQFLVGKKSFWRPDGQMKI